MTVDEMCKGCYYSGQCTADHKTEINNYVNGFNVTYIDNGYLKAGCPDYQHGSLYAPAPGSGAELIEMLTAVRECIDDISSAAETINTTVLHPIKPDSLRSVIDMAIEYISNNDILIL